MRQFRAVRETTQLGLRIGYVALGLIVCAIVANAPNATAAPFQVGAGYDYYSGPAHQITRTALATASAGFGPVGNVTVAGLRYDDNQTGKGSGIVGGIGLPLVPLSSLQIFGYRFIGDDTFRAWRAKAGPRIGIPGGSSVSLYYSHYEDNNNVKSDGGIAELSVPLVARVIGRASGAFASVPGDLKSAQGQIGVTWAAARFVELSGDVGLAHNGVLTGTALPSRRRLDLPLLGAGSSGSSTNTAQSFTESTYQVGVRVLFP